jgi:hypothetical protein
MLQELTVRVVGPNRAMRRALEKENLLWPENLRQIPQTDWPTSSHPTSPKRIECWRSRAFLVQVFSECGGIERLSVCRTSHNGNRWEENITWDELQRLKAECGRGDRQAVEIFPADRDVVNVANMRHLWVLVEPLPFAWCAK